MSNIIANIKNGKMLSDTMITDTMTTIGDSIIQHGKFNDRIYLMKLSRQDFPYIIEELDRVALQEGYSKIFAKVPSFAKDKFIDNDYIVEGRIPKFYNGIENVYFMGKYFVESRMFDNRIDETNDVLNIAMSYRNEKKNYNKNHDKNYNKNENICNNIKFDIPYGFDCRICDKSHIYQIADIYKNVFGAYPFPIHDPEYIAKTMNENFIYFSIHKNDKIVAVSSSEMDIDSENVEMTDFATLCEYRGKGFALYLLYQMECEMRKRNMKVTYTISRALSHGANIIFAKMGYKYGGTLYNNTNISIDKTAPGNFESMNVWYRYL